MPMKGERTVISNDSLAMNIYPYRSYMGIIKRRGPEGRLLPRFATENGNIDVLGRVRLYVGKERVQGP